MITLKKAIRVNNDILAYWNSVMDTESKEAIKLGSEALNRIEQGRVLHNPHCLRKLPGETRE